MRLKLFPYLFLLGFVVSCSKFFPQKESNSLSDSSSLSSVPSLSSPVVSPTTNQTSDTSKNESDIKGLSLLHVLPKIPSQTGPERFFISSFANKEDDKKNSELMNKNPPVEMLIEGDHKTDGTHYCFSNDVNSLGVECSRPRFDSEVLTQIKGFQDSGTARQALYMSALQFMFKSSDKEGASKVVFEGATIEKAPVSFDPKSGELNPVAQDKKIKISYGSSCKLSDENAVGFDSLSSSLGREFYLTGVWSYSRTKRKAFAETQSIQEEDRCQDEDSKVDWYCHLFVDKAQVWYAALMPVLFQNPVTGEKGFGHRQFPSQVSGSMGLEGGFSAEQGAFGLYEKTSDTKGFVKTPEMGKVDDKGNPIKDWEKTFITGLCLKGYRIEKSNTEKIQKIPFMQALRLELRSPQLKVLR